LCAFSRPPLATTPEREAFVSTFSRALFICATVAAGFAANPSAAAPETCGAAIEVPFRNS
jgi:hypothetical protein